MKKGNNDSRETYMNQAEQLKKGFTKFQDPVICNLLSQT